ncbi:hypothetical protein V3C99_013981 [Haemonchus contortus]
MSSDTVTSVGDTTEALPPQVFVGIKRTYAAMWYCFVCLFSIMLHTIFITATKRLCGWESNFSFTLLLLLSTMAMVFFAALMLSSFTALLYMDWIKYQILWIVVTIVLGIIFVGIVALLNTKLIGVRWIASLMNYVAMKSRSVILFDILNQTTNYVTGVVNIVVNAIMLFTIWKRKMLSSSRNQELKVTLQVSLMMAIEVAFFLYWEVSVFLVGFGDLDYIIAETSLLLYYDVLILPYLILNRHIHHEFRRIFLCQKNTMTGALWLRRVRNHSTSPCS